MPLNNQGITNKKTIYSLLQALKDTINYNLNCVKVATVIEFDAVNLTAKCRVNNKRLRQINNQGNQILEDYPDIFAKVCFFGWGDIAITHPVNEGMEGILLFNDREIETWYLTGGNGKLAYDRCHDLTDALFFCGLTSQPARELIQYLVDAIHIVYKETTIKINEEAIISSTKKIIDTALESIEENTKAFTNKSEDSYTIETDAYSLKAKTIIENADQRNITSTTSHNGTITATQLNDSTAATGSFTTSNNKTVTVVNGIIRSIV